LLVASALLALFTVMPAFAAIPGPPNPGTLVGTNTHIPQKRFAIQSTAWLFRKHHFQIRRTGVKLPSGCPSASTPNLCTPPDGYELSYGTVETTLEPSGNPRTSWPSNPPISAQIQQDYGGNYDDAHNMYTNYNMYGLCAPGALTNALSYWGAPVASNGTQQFTDLSVIDNPTTAAKWGATAQTTWGDISYNDIYDGGNENINHYAHRSYMMYIAWETNPAGNFGLYPGVMDSSHYPSEGAWLQWMQDALNWEASGHNYSTWTNFFYTIQWDANGNPGGGTQAMLLSDVESDLWYSRVPVVAEVNANLLPNWPGGGQIKHAITIIGYDNTSGTYTYVDSCGSANGRGTGCGALSQQQIHTVDQSVMYNAINNVMYHPGTGDGGWIW
jgi:hypothetical protein